MTVPKPTALKKKSYRPDLYGLVALRRAWRAFHEKQDRENADRVFREAGVELIAEGDLKFFPPIFRQKLNEFGRDWERTLAAQGLRENFSLYRVQLLIRIDDVNALHIWIENAFGSAGAPLFFESNGLHALKDGKWDAIFYFMLGADESEDRVSFSASPGVETASKILRIA